MVTRARIPRGIILVGARAILTAANMAPLLAAVIHGAVHGGMAARRAGRPASPGGLWPTVNGKLLLDGVRNVGEHQQVIQGIIGSTPDLAAAPAGAAGAAMGGCWISPGAAAPASPWNGPPAIGGPAGAALGSGG